MASRDVVWIRTEPDTTIVSLAVGNPHPFSPRQVMLSVWLMTLIVARRSDGTRSPRALEPSLTPPA